MPPVLDHEIFHRSQQKRPQPTLVLLRRKKIPALQKPRKEALRQILRILRPRSLPPDESIDRIPIESAQLLNGISRRAGIAGPQIDDQRPAGRGEGRRT